MRNSNKSMTFQYKEDEEYFIELFGVNNIDEISEFFDFRDPIIKRKEFNKIRNKLLRRLIEEQGSTCGLSYNDICDMDSGFSIDHIIPIQSNYLNKHLRNMKPLEKGKKVPQESYGSNNNVNLVLSCNKCNGHKKNNILSKDHLKKVLNR